MFRSSGMRSMSAQLTPSTILPLGGQDLKTLRDMIAAEKCLISSFHRVSQDFGKSAEALKLWGSGEGDDLDDILTHSHNILQLLVTALNRFAAHEETIPTLMKGVKTQETKLDELRRKHRNVVSKVESAEKKLSKIGVEHKNREMQANLVNGLKEERKALDTELMTEEARIGDYKRRATKEWMNVKHGAISELGHKLIIIGEQGKLLTEVSTIELNAEISVVS
ncbi:hypothetical protein FRC02_008809 [Tulasnella sp. 418]|nr:hypothetical protein FRC02_008809 [Tulasnella sp. 418]